LLLSFVEQEKLATDTDTLTKVDPALDRREVHHSNLLFGLWLISSYLGNLSSLVKILGLFTIPGVILGLTRWCPDGTGLLEKR